MKRWQDISARVITSVIIGSAVVVYGQGTVQAEGGEGSEQPVRFAVVGDRTGEHQEGVYERIIAEVERLKPEFVITVGDHIEGYHEDSALYDAQWDEYFAIVKGEPRLPLGTMQLPGAARELGEQAFLPRVTGSMIASMRTTPGWRDSMPGLSMPLWITPGNHDCLNASAVAAFERRIGKRYYSFDYRGLHFVVLDNSQWEAMQGFPQDQMEWLEKDLAANAGAVKTFVFHHKPFWYYSTANGKEDALHSLFVKYGVDAVFTGHFHEYFTGEYDGIKYTNMGSSGGGARDETGRILYHFAWVTVSDAGIDIAPIKIGAVLPWDEVTASDLAFGNRLAMEGITFAHEIEVEDETPEVMEQTVVVTLHNLYEGAAMADTLRWAGQPNWEVTPSAMVVSVGPGETTTATFKAVAKGAVYPLPTVESSFPYRVDRMRRVTVPLALARVGTCVRAEKPPVIDGSLEEAEWRGGVRNLLNDESGPETTDPTEAYFAYDAEYLYIGARCTERVMDSLKALVAVHDGTVYGEDCVGFFVQPDPALDTAYQIYVNPKGIIFDQQLTPSADGYWAGNREWNGEYEVKVARGESEWVAEMRVPLSQWGVKLESGDRMRVNVRRKQARLGVSSQWQAPIEYNPKTFGVLRVE